MDEWIKKMWPWAGSVPQVVESLHSKHKAQRSNPSTKKRKENATCIHNEVSFSHKGKQNFFFQENGWNWRSSC
jgi:hypothetical protein